MVCRVPFGLPVEPEPTPEPEPVYGLYGTTAKDTFGVAMSDKYVYTDPEDLDYDKRYVLADPSKYNQLYSVIFADLSQAAVITTALPDKQLRSHTTVIETDLGKEQTSS